MPTITKLAYMGNEYEISAENAYFASQFGTGAEGDCVIDTSRCLCARTYNFKNLTICPNVRVQFCGCGVPVIKVYNCLCNMGCIDLRNEDTIPDICVSCGTYGTYGNHPHTGTITLCCCGGTGAYKGGDRGQAGGNGYVCGGAACGDNGGGGAGGATGRCGNCTGWGYGYTGYPGCDATLTNGGNGGEGGGSCCGGGTGGGGGYGICCGGNGGAGGAYYKGGTGGNGGFGCYKGGNGGAGRYGGNGGRGGDSHYGDAGAGGNSDGYSDYSGSAGSGGVGGNTIWGNGGDGGRGGCNCNACPYGAGGNGGCTFYGKGGEGGKNSNGGYSGCGGSAFGGMYGMLIIARNVYNNQIIGGGYDGGSGSKGGDGSAGAEIGIFYGCNFTRGTITYEEGKGGAAGSTECRGCDGAKGKLLLSKVTV